MSPEDKESFINNELTRRIINRDDGKDYFEFNCELVHYPERDALTGMNIQDSVVNN